MSISWLARLEARLHQDRWVSNVSFEPDQRQNIQDREFSTALGNLESVSCPGWGKLTSPKISVQCFGTKATLTIICDLRVLQCADIMTDKKTLELFIIFSSNISRSDEHFLFNQ